MCLKDKILSKQEDFLSHKKRRDKVKTIMASDEKPPYRERVTGRSETYINDMPTDKNNLTNTARNEVREEQVIHN
jgi:hypothetical protein